MQRILKTTFLFAIALVFTAGMAFAQNNEAYIDQQDNNNTATVSQDGASNDAAVGQGLLEGWGFTQGLGSVFPYPQLDEPSAYAEDNEATITQVGTRNAAVLNQGVGNDANSSSSADNNTGTISQDGNRNVAAPGQGTYGGEAVDNVLDINQVGDENFAVASQAIQSAYAKDNNSDIDQYGDGNIANTYQGFGTNGDARSNFAKSYQDGDDNESYITQGGGPSGLGLTAAPSGYSANNQARIFQGDGGFAADNYAEISQLGTFHTARVEQLGTNHQADVDQAGSTNDATITQNN